MYADTGTPESAPAREELPQSPTISVPLKTTSEIDWVSPLMSYIEERYGNPEKYSEECETLNRLRQDMRSAGKDFAVTRDLLYRYYGQLELLDLRFPVEERKVRVSFTWHDAFTQKPTSQFSLAFEKASIIFNISALHSCYAASQDRVPQPDTGLKAAYHHFRAAAGMFTYINENFLHAPSTDLSRDCVNTLITIMQAQAQEVCVEKQVHGNGKASTMAKLASHAGTLYHQATEGCQQNAQKGVFDKSWTAMCYTKQLLMDSKAQFFQAKEDGEKAKPEYGVEIARLQLAKTIAQEAVQAAKKFPKPSQSSNLPPDTGAILVKITKHHLEEVSRRLEEADYVNNHAYHYSVPAEASLPPIKQLPAADPIPVQELYATLDIGQIIGPDIFQKIVPLEVTRSASLYDEEKAKMVRAETEKVDQANGELMGALDYLKLPQSLKLLKGGYEDTLECADELREWCTEMAGKQESLEARFQELKTNKKKIIEVLDSSTKALDQEEAVCEKMRTKYQAEWTQQPSSRLTQTLRADIRSYREAVDAAVQSDNQLFTQYKTTQEEISGMRSAGERADQGAVDILWNTKAKEVARSLPTSNGKSQNAESLVDVDHGLGGPTVLEQIEKVEELLKRLNMLKKERVQVLKDLKEKVHNDDISNVLILNRKAAQNHEQELFASELEKFRPHRNRLVQAVHKQSALMKELTVAYEALLKDPRVQAEQSKYEALSRQRNAVLSKFRKTYQTWLDIWAGLDEARRFYTEMVETAESLEKNVETFVANRKSEGSMLLASVEKSKGTDVEQQQKKLREMMERVSLGSAPPPVERLPQHHSQHVSPHNPGPKSPPMTPRYSSAYQSTPTPPPGAAVPPPPPPKVQQPQPPLPPPPVPQQYQHYQQPYSYSQQPPPQPQYARRGSYQATPMARRDSSQPLPSPALPPPGAQTYQPSHYSTPPNMYSGHVAGYPPPPPQPYNPGNYAGMAGPGANRTSYDPLPQTTYQQPAPQQGQAEQGAQADPWAGLSAWK